jgi:homospermidine synthase
LVGNAHNATVLQVSASLLGVIAWMIENPKKGFCVPENLPYHEILRVANPYLGPCLSAQTNWVPSPKKDPVGRWQFENFLVKIESSTGRITP